MKSITLKELNEFAKRAEVSENVQIYALGAVVGFMAACRKDNNEEFITLDESYLERDHVTDGDDNTVVLGLWSDDEGDLPDYPICENCRFFHSAGTRNPDTGYCKLYNEEVDVDGECDEHGWEE